MNGLILWVDDEIELLKAHIIFLEKKGYTVATASNGADAIEMCRERTYDLVLLDEMMPGLSGLETLQQLKELQPATPVVMCTKSEEENIMDQAIGSKIADYLIKPVNPSQILLSLKKNIHQKDLVTEATQTSYRQSYMQLQQLIADARTVADFQEVYRQLVRWELELTEADTGMNEMLAMQREEANQAFAKHVAHNYMRWMDTFPKGTGSTRSTPPMSNNHYSLEGDRPLMSPDVMRSSVFPLLDEGHKVYLIVIDNFRLDQWRMLRGELADLFDIDEQLYTTILPTATQYARNAIFSGLMPDMIARLFPDLWVDEDEDEGKNLNEAPLIKTLIERYRRHDTFSYHKLNDSPQAERLLERLPELRKNDLNVVVVNFIDMLSHARTESKMVRELAGDEAAYRSITLSWLRHSPLADLFRRLSQEDCRVVVTTDHGSIHAAKPIKIVGDRNTNTNLRYKLGRNLNYSAKEVFTIARPQDAHLPAPNLSTTYAFATGGTFFAYPNNYNHYVAYYKDTFQHGGISMEEMFVPIVTMSPRRR